MPVNLSCRKYSFTLTKIRCPTYLKKTQNTRQKVNKNILFAQLTLTIYNVTMCKKVDSKTDVDFAANYTR